MGKCFSDKINVSAKLLNDLFRISGQTLKGDCWQGTQCALCDRNWVGNINGVKVCCSKCEKKGFVMSPNSCSCRR